jgi:RNA polymerase sigma factor (sigma-70 family)
VLYLQYRPLLLAIAGRKFRVPEEDCEPIVQEVILSFVTCRVHVVNARAWLVAAACNASRHYWRHRMRVDAVEGVRLESLSEHPHIPHVENLERRILIRALLARLRPKQREVLRLHYVEGRTASEVASALRITPRYAEKLIRNAVRELRALYEEGQTRPSGARRATSLPVEISLRRR